MVTNEPSISSCSDCTAVNQTDSIRSESTESVCATSTEPANELEVLPSAPVARRSCMQLNVSNLSLFHSEIGYVVTKTMYNSVCLRSIAAVELHPFGRDAHLTPTSEIGGILL